MEINNIITAISIKLEQAFGESYTKYDDEVPQEFSTPAFFIQFLNLEHKRQIGNRWRVTTLFNVQYFPSNGTPESANMTLKIQQALKDITLLDGSQMLGTEANSEVVDSIAHNFIHFNFFLQEVEEEIFMESIAQHSKIRGE